MKKQYNVQTSYAAAIPRGSRNGAGEGLRRTVVTSSGGGDVDLSSKLDASVFYDFFEKVNIGTAAEPKYAIHAKYGLYTDSFLSALGLNPNTGGGGGGSYDRLDTWEEYTSERAGWVLSAALGYDLHSRVSSLEGGIVPDLSEYATRTWVQQQGYATSAALAAHAGDAAIHISSAERTLWNKTAADFAAIVGEDSDDIINKWEEVVAFLDTYTEADTLANLLSNKVDKTTKVVAGTGLTGGGALAGNVTLSLASRTLWGQTYDGSKNVSGDMTDVGSITASGGLITTATNAVRAVAGDYGAILRNDGTLFALLLTDAEDQYGGANSFRPLYVDLSDSTVYIGKAAATIKHDGNVGIGTTAPAYKLDVAGDARLQNRLYFGDSAHYIEVDGDGYFHFSHGVYTDGFLSALGLNSSGGGGEGGASYDRLDAWSDYTSERAGWVLSAALGYDLHSRVSSLEGGSALSFTTEGTGNVVTAVKKSGTAVVVTKGLTALTSHQPIYSLNFQAGAFEAKKYTPNTGAQTVNIPTKTSHLSNDSGFITAAALTGYATQSWVQGLGYITASALTPYITEATAEATFATKLGISGNQIGTYVNGKLGNLITVPYSTNADTLDLLHSSDFFRQYDLGGGATSFDFDTYTNAGYSFASKDTGSAIFVNAPFTNSAGGFGVLSLRYSSYTTQIAAAYGSAANLYARARYYSGGNIVWGDWRTIAYADSNVASATKLQTARSLWGQPFDGLKDIDGEMAFAKVGGVQLRLSSAIGVRYTATSGGWSKGMSWRSADGSTSLGAIEAFGYGDSITYWYVGQSYDNPILTITPAGNVGIGTKSAVYPLDVTGVIHSTEGIFSDGYVSAKGQNTASDARLKRRMADVALTVRDVAEAPVYRFAWINGGGIDVGSTAQYWAAKVPELTHKLPDGKYYGLDYGKTALLSVIAVARRVQNHEERIAELEKAKVALERENEQLKQTLKKYIS